jgi:uncharacterized protein (DUF1697 family)
LQITREQFGAELETLDFAQSEAARQQINQWVAQQTEQKIKDLIPDRALSADTRLVLTNAIYFHGVWSDPFREDRTQEEAFHLTVEDEVVVPLMHRRGAYRYAAVDALRILELPYGDGSLSMLVLLPDEVAGLGDLEAKLTFDNLQRWIGSLQHEDDVRVYLPKFKTASQFELSDTLRSMGMELPFDARAADFSGMADGSELALSAVIHKAFVDVNEEGTEAQPQRRHAVFGTDRQPAAVRACFANRITRSLCGGNAGMGQAGGLRTWIALLRGVNVGGRNVLPMGQLAAILEELGCSPVKTYIQSGNAVFRSVERDAFKLAESIAVAIHRQRGFQPQVMLQSLQDLEKVLAANPFPQADGQPNTLHIFFLAGEADPAKVAALEAIRAESERLELTTDVLYLHAPGGVGRSKLAASAERLLGVPATARNLRSLRAIAEIARGIA